MRTVCLKSAIRYLLMIAAVCCLVCTSCSRNPQSYSASTGSNSTDSSQNDQPILFYRKIAREFQSDGWCFSFIEEDMKEKHDPDIIRYSFSGFNLRYRYITGYVSYLPVENKETGKTDMRPYYTGMSNWVDGPEANKRDYKNVLGILDSTKEPEELLALDTDQFEFEVLDRDVFFKLMHEALGGEAHAEGKAAYLNLPTWAMLVEPEYMDGYEFQVSYMNGMGCVDIIFIDVCYKNGARFDDYDQLSDLVEAGTASAEQVHAYQELKEIEKGIITNNSFLDGIDSYEQLTIGGVDFSRLAAILRNLEANNYLPYVREPVMAE